MWRFQIIEIWAKHMRGEAVVAEHLAKRYGNGVWGATDITFTVMEGTITVLMGPNGAGKTTTVGMLSTILKPTMGIGIVGGYDIVKQPREVRRIIALCPQDIRIDPNWTPLEAVIGYLWIRGQSISDARINAKKWLEDLELWDIRNRPAYSLSGGQRKRIAVAMVLASDAQIIFLDEPTSGLDVEAKQRVWRSLREAVKNGKTILLTTHDMSEAETVSDKLIFIHRGKVVAEGTVADIRAKIPYHYKVVIKKPHTNYSFNYRVRTLGDTVIVYTQSYREALDLVSRIHAESISIQSVTLEDVYLFLVEKIRGGEI